MSYIEQLNWRYATKQFNSDKSIPEDTWESIEQSLVLTPSSFGLQPWKFVVVTDPILKEKLQAQSWGQAQVSDCSHLVVLCAQKNLTKTHIEQFIARTVELRGGKVEDLAGYQELMEGFISRMSEAERFSWAKNQVYIALGQLMATAAALEVDACPLEGIIPAEYDKLIDLEGFKTVVVCALGYRSADDKHASLAKVRYTANELIERR